MKGNKFLAAVMAASMAFSVVPATALNVFADPIVLVGAMSNFTSINSCTVNGTDSADLTAGSEAKAIYDIIAGASISGSSTTADAVKTDLQTAFDTDALTSGKSRTVKSNTLTGVTATSGTVVVAGSDGADYTLVFSQYTPDTMTSDEEAALSDLFAGISAITYSGNSITTNVVQTAFNDALKKAQTSATDDFFGPNKTGNGYTYTVDTAAVSGDTVTGTLSRVAGSKVYHYTYSAAAIQNSESEADIIKAAIAQIKKNEYPSFASTDPIAKAAVEAKIRSDIKELVAGKANPTVTFGTEIEATHDDDGRIVATIGGVTTTIKLTHSSSEKITEAENAVVKGLNKDNKATASDKTIYEKSDLTSDVSTSTNTYEFKSSSAFSRAIQSSTATTAVDAETVRAAVEKVVTEATKDYAADGVTYSVESFDGYYGTTTGAAQKKATSNDEGAYVVKVTASIQNDFYGFDASSVSQDATTTATYYVVVNTPKLKKVAVKSISLSDKTYVRKQNYTYDNDKTDTVAPVKADVIELKAGLTPEDANGAIKWSVTKTDGTVTTDALVTAGSGNTGLKDADGKTVTVADTDGKLIVLKSGTYKVTATAGTVKATMTLTVKDNFNDVSATAYYSDAVAWAYAKGITAGVNESTFGSNSSVTRGQFVTWLYKYAVSKDSSAAIADSDVKSVFSDVSTSAFYAKAVQWAVANGVTSGTSSTTFSPDQTITRAQALTMLWHVKGEPLSGKGQEDEVAQKFTDLPSNSVFRTAVVWAVKNNVTAGTTPTTCSPDDVCARSQAITFIHVADTL